MDTLGLGAVRTVTARVEPGAVSGSWSVHFESEAVRGTLAAFAGVLTLCGLDITSAVILKSGGMVRDSFDVEPLDDRLISRDAEDRLASLASDALNGRMDLRAALRDLHSSPEYVRTPGATDVETMSDSEITTGVRVRTPDRPGLLFDLASTLSDHGLRTRSLTVVTFHGQAYDTFRVVNQTGGIVDDEDALSRLRQSLCLAAESR